MRWQPTDAGHYCTEHGETFARGEVCTRCVSEPSTPPGAPQLSEDIDREIVALAGEFTSRARRLWREADTLLGGTDLEKNIAGKLSSESAKWERLALEAKDKVASRKHLREAMEHERAMSGQRGRH
jgi:hypothetical protein